MSYQPPTQPGVAGASTAQDPGQTMAIVGIVLDFLFPPVGLILSVLANKKSREAGFDGQLSKIGKIIGIITTILWVIGIVVNIGVLVAAMSAQGM